MLRASNDEADSATATTTANSVASHAPASIPSPAPASLLCSVVSFDKSSPSQALLLMMTTYYLGKVFLARYHDMTPSHFPVLLPPPSLCLCF